MHATFLCVSICGRGVQSNTKILNTIVASKHCNTIFRTYQDAHIFVHWYGAATHASHALGKTNHTRTHTNKQQEKESRHPKQGILGLGCGRMGRILGLACGRMGILGLGCGRMGILGLGCGRMAILGLGCGRMGMLGLGCGRTGILGLESRVISEQSKTNLGLKCFHFGKF